MEKEKVFENVAKKIKNFNKVLIVFLSSILEIKNMKFIIFANKNSRIIWSLNYLLFTLIRQALINFFEP